MFQLKEINQMEREMCGYLEWHLNIDYQELEQFTEKTQLEFGSGVVSGPLPMTSSIARVQPKTAAPESPSVENHSILSRRPGGGDPCDFAGKR